MIRAVATCIMLATSSAFAGPPGDYGDAPVGNTGDGIMAYPGVVARWPTRFDHTNTVFQPQRPHGAWLNIGSDCWLGTIPPSAKFDSAMTPGGENDSAPVILLYTDPLNVGTQPLADMELSVSAGPGHNPAAPVYLNVWIDQNRDGQWKDGYYLGTSLAHWTLEWVVEDLPIYLPAGQTVRPYIRGIRLENPTQPVWLRAMVSPDPVGTIMRGPAGTPEMFWDSTMIDAHAWTGEIEDVLLGYYTSPPSGPVTPGIWHMSTYTGNPPGPGSRKPICASFFIGMSRDGPSFLNGPFNRQTLYCSDPGAPDVVTLLFATHSRNNGCTISPNVLIALYGTRHIDGIPGPPTISWRGPTPGPAGVAGMTCPPAAGGNVYNLPANIPNQGPLIDSMLAPVPSLDPSQVKINVCYPRPPKGYRKYRFWVQVMGCGSLHPGHAVEPSPESGVSLVAAINTPYGQDRSYADVWVGGLDEEFQDPAEGVPFPAPAFANFTILPRAPGMFWFLDAGQFTTPPTGLHLHEAIYHVSPQIPNGLAVRQISFAHAGAVLALRAIDANGMTLTLPLHPGLPEQFESTTLALPDGFSLQTLEIEALDGVIDSLSLTLDNPTPPPSACNPDLTGDGNADQDDVVYLINAIGGGGNPNEVDTDFNRDGNTDQDDVVALINTIGGAECP
jgi:hypothetical protein